MNGASIIKYAWYRLYIKFAGDPEFQDAAVLRIAAREASKLAADAAAAAAVVLASAVVVEGVALNGENGNAALVGIDLSSISTDVLVAHCREMERKAHMAEIPSHRNSKRKSKGKQLGSRQSSRVEKYQRTADIEAAAQGQTAAKVLQIVVAVQAGKAVRKCGNP